MGDTNEHQANQFIEGSLDPRAARELAQASLDDPELFEELTYQAVAKHGLRDADPRQVGADPLHAFLRGRLSPVEQRRLAQAALASEELFDTLAAHGAVEWIVSDPAFREALSRPADSRPKISAFPRRARAIAIIGSIAAAVAVISFYSWRLRPPERIEMPVDNARTSPKLRTPNPSLGWPILLADLMPGPVDARAPVFRSAETTSRPPRPSGTVLSVEEGQVTVSLGSLDGLTKGAEVQIFRGGNSKQPIARLLVTAVFRDRARGRVDGGQSIRPRDRVNSQPDVYFTAVLQEMNRLADRGDRDKARSLARAALEWADSKGVPPGFKRRVLERLAVLDFQAGESSEAEKDYRSAIANFATDPPATAVEQAVALNSLGVLYMNRRHYADAEMQFNAARAKIADGAVYARTLNNLGVLAEYRGDPSKAEALYKDAQRALAGAEDARHEDRRALEENLSRLERGEDGKR